MSLEGPVPDSTVHGLDWPKQMPGEEGGDEIYNFMQKAHKKHTVQEKG